MTISEEIKNFVIEGYRNILNRDPAPDSLSYHTQLINIGRISRDMFLNVLIESNEYADRFGQKRINFFQNFPKGSGYGILGDNISSELIKYGYDINNITGPHLGKFDTDTHCSYISLILSTPLSFFRSRSKITIGYTMFETNRIPASWIPGCNTVDRIFVPIESNVDTFRNCGVNVPIDVIPIGIDTNIYDPYKIKRKFNFVNNNKMENVPNDIINNAYKFLVINEGQARKNNQMIIDAFHQEFSMEIERNEIYLIVRTQNPYQGKNVSWINKYINDDDMPLFINSCDCMINASSGECGDIPIVEGMAMEKPVIVSNDHLLHSEIIEEGKTGFLIDIDRWEIAFQHPSYRGVPYLIGLDNASWVIPSTDSLRRKMRYVYDNREIAKDIGRNARQYVSKNRSIDISIQKMIDIFENS